MSDGFSEALRNIKKYKPTLVVNIFGGPGSGKSIICANLFSELKWQHISSEMALEYVKDEVWEDNTNAISNQLFILGNQHQRIHRLLDKVKVVITDSPLLFSILYDQEKNENFHKYVLDKFNSYENLNIFIKRNDEKFESVGRIHNLKQSKQKDEEIKNLLESNNINYIELDMKKESIDIIINKIKKYLNE